MTICLVWGGLGFLKTWLVARRAALRELPSAGVLETILLWAQHCRLVTGRMLHELESRKPPQFVVSTCYSTYSPLRVVRTGTLGAACKCSRPRAVWDFGVFHSFPYPSRVKLRLRHIFSWVDTVHGLSFPPLLDSSL